MNAINFYIKNSFRNKRIYRGNLTLICTMHRLSGGDRSFVYNWHVIDQNGNAAPNQNKCRVRSMIARGIRNLFTEEC